MTTEQLFTQALLLDSPWRVEKNSFEGEPKRLVLHLELAPGTRALACPECGAGGCAIHDRRERTWRHLNFWQYQTVIHAKVPRVRCAKCGVHQVEVPWARPGSGFTLLFEAFALELIRHMPVSNAADFVGENDKRIWTIIEHYVEKAYQQSDWKEVERVAIDETSRRKGHTYVTNFVDLDTGRLLFMAEGSDSETVGQFAEQLFEFSGDPAKISEAAIDMSAAYKKGVAEHLPEAKVAFDRFHVAQLAGEAFEKVRKEVSAEAGGLGRGGMWALRGNASRLNEEMGRLREELLRTYDKLKRAMGLREMLANFYRYATVELAEEHFDAWYSWARRCRMESFKKLAKTLREHFDGIKAYYNNFTTSAIIENLNGRLQRARQRAYGYRNFRSFQLISYWIAGGISPATGLSNPLPRPF
jgi:transposase